MFSDDLLRNSLAFRGGTALHKLFIRPQVRYSEDIFSVIRADIDYSPHKAWDLAKEKFEIKSE
jgi:predicted nucleotidyltransferase component of viral defense system